MRTILLVTFLLPTFNVFANDFLWKKLQQDENMIVLMRNSESSGNNDGRNMLAWDKTGNCKGESRLTKKGKTHAIKIGQAFTKYGIKPLVISSPMCRCSETAKIAFKEYITAPDLRQSAMTNTQQQEKFQAKTKTLLRKHRGKTPIVFVNHRPNIDSLTMELLGLGDLLLGTINKRGEIDVIGTIHVEL